jgi:integrase
MEFHLLPFFRHTHFAEITPFLIKKFVAKLKSRKNQKGGELSGKRIQNIMIPLRVIFRDAVAEYEWQELKDPFPGIKVPIARKNRVQPFNFEEWKTIMEFMKPWYKPYFEFAVQTGLRPSEQVALKWSAIDEEFIEIELSRVRNKEKKELKQRGVGAG